jgi:hypothetical protein
VRNSFNHEWIASRHLLINHSIRHFASLFSRSNYNFFFAFDLPLFYFTMKFYKTLSVILVSFSSVALAQDFWQPLDITFVGTQSTPCGATTVDAIQSMTLEALNNLVQEHGPTFGVTDLSYTTFEAISETLQFVPADGDNGTTRRRQLYDTSKYYSYMNSKYGGGCSYCTGSGGNDVWGRRVLQEDSSSASLRGGVDDEQRETQELTFGGFLGGELTNVIGNSLFGGITPLYDCLVGVESMTVTLGSPQSSN